MRGPGIPSGMPEVPADRIALGNRRPVNTEGTHVLYWMTAARRTRRNYGLQRALEWSKDLGRPLVVLEGLRSDYR